MATKKTNWLLIILGIVIFVVIVGIAAVVGFGYWMYRQMEFSSSTNGHPEQEFTQVEEQFRGQVPYVDITFEDGEEKAVVHHEQEKATREPLQKLRLVAYDKRENRLVRLSIPFWLVRLGGNHPIKLNSGQSGWDPGVQLSITPEDLERHGRGLVIDTTGRHGDRVIIWAE